MMPVLTGLTERQRQSWLGLLDVAADFPDGFTSAGVSPEGHQHRGVRDRASIDVLIPHGLGLAAVSKTGITGGTTLATPGAQRAIKRSGPVTVQVDDEVGRIRRPNMLGALIAKAAAFSVPSDSAKERHLTDFATLAAMTRGSDRIAEQLTVLDRHYLAPMLVALDNSRRLWASIEGAERGVLSLAAITATPSKRTVIGPQSPTTAPEPPAPDL
jgi:hypothetical protein